VDEAQKIKQIRQAQLYNNILVQQVLPELESNLKTETEMAIRKYTPKESQNLDSGHNTITLDQGKNRIETALLEREEVQSLKKISP